jgi:predicted nucleic acid-binding protein
MIAIVDANIFLRLADTASPQYLTAMTAVNICESNGFELLSFNQSAYEFWVVATRPLANNGLGLAPSVADHKLDQLLLAFPQLDDKHGLFTEWRTLVNTHSISGKPAHDARYVAAMNTYSIAHILSFNVADFARFPGITVLDPVAIAATATP